VSAISQTVQWASCLQGCTEGRCDGLSRTGAGRVLSKKMVEAAYRDVPTRSLGYNGIQRASSTIRDATCRGGPLVRQAANRGPKSGVVQKDRLSAHHRSRMDSATIPVIPTSLRRLMPLQEGARAIDRTRLQLRRLRPREHRDLGIRAERGDIDRSNHRMRDNVVR
jgi:hypothetical protein